MYKGRHRSGRVAPQGKGRHRKPTETGKRVARVATAGAIAGMAPVMMGAGVANAAPAQSGGFSASAQTTSGGFDHDAIAKCESGGDARAQNSSSSASGLYQFIDGTWKAYGGSTKRAKDASVSEQRRVAERAFAAEGYTPWASSRSCWSGKLGNTKTRVTNGDTASSNKSTNQRSAKPKVKSVETVTPKKATPKKATPKRATSSPSGTYTVRAGDTLSEIAMDRGMSWRALHSKNRAVVGGNPNLIVPGQRLDVSK